MEKGPPNNELGEVFEAIMGYEKKYKGIGGPTHFLGFDCFSYGLNKRFFIQELKTNLIDSLQAQPYLIPSELKIIQFQWILVES